MLDAKGMTFKPEEQMYIKHTLIGHRWSKYHILCPEIRLMILLEIKYHQLCTKSSNQIGRLAMANLFIIWSEILKIGMMKIDSNIKYLDGQA